MFLVAGLPYDTTYTYSNNVQCKLFLEILPNYQLVYNVGHSLDLEKNCDIITYYINDDIYHLTHVTKTSILQAPKKDSLKINWMFSTDGSVTRSNFRLIFDNFGKRIKSKLFKLSTIWGKLPLNFLQSVNVVLQ